MENRTGIRREETHLVVALPLCGAANHGRSRLSRRPIARAVAASRSDTFTKSRAETEIGEVGDTIAPPIRDPQDTRIVQTAISGKAEYICTLDRSLSNTITLMDT